jgi:hypothetical protein
MTRFPKPTPNPSSFTQTPRRLRGERTVFIHPKTASHPCSPGSGARPGTRWTQVWRFRLDSRPSALHNSKMFAHRLNPETASRAQSAKSDFLSITLLLNYIFSSQNLTNFKSCDFSNRSMRWQLK